MSRIGKSLWSEDARRPCPLELAQWSRVGRPGGAVGLRVRELLVCYELDLRVEPWRQRRRKYEKRGFEHRTGHKQSAKRFDILRPEMLLCRKAHLPASQLGCKDFRLHTEMKTADHILCHSAKALGTVKLVQVSSSRFMATTASNLHFFPWLPVPHHSSSYRCVMLLASGLAKRINLRP